MSGRSRRQRLIRGNRLSRVESDLGTRDLAILLTVARLRLVTARQIERLHFSALDSGSSRARIRMRVLARLVSWRVLATLPRRIGGVRAGSAGLVITLDAVGQQIAQMHGDGNPPAGAPGLRFIQHTLAVSELYVSLVELCRLRDCALPVFDTEPRCWWPNGLGGTLKPDAFFVLVRHGYANVWWLEQDMKTEHLPTIRRKLTAYLDFNRRGQLGPTGIMPRILVAVPDEARKRAIEEVIRKLPEPASELIRVVESYRASEYLGDVLQRETSG
jgi:Replication-relaxation